VQQGFEGPAGSRHAQVIGRGDLLAQARARLTEGGSVLLYGPAGIGKSTILQALTADSAERGHTVLRCAPTESESQLPFLALVDLLGLVANEVADTLPAPQRAALESALTGRTESAEQRDALALRLAVLSVLRALAARNPVFVVVDDLNWMDPASAELLAFAARRVGGLPVQILVAVRTDSTPVAPDDRFLRALPPQSLTIRVPPLSGPQVSELLASSGQPALPNAILRDVHRTSGGNPLFALELGRALVEAGTQPRPGEPLPVPTSLRTLVLNRLDLLSAGTRRTLLFASAGARPTLELLRSAGRQKAGAEIAVAAALGLVRVDPPAGGLGDGVVRFSHPLISAALYAAAPPRDRRRAHAALAAAASDPIERARHLALATACRDRRVADGLSEAAAVARDRGAPEVAAQLGLLAARYTPVGSARTVDERMLQAAEDAVLAGGTELARSTAREVLGRATEPGDRVRAWVVVIRSVGQALADVDDVFPQALADAGDDPRLLAVVRYHLAWRFLLADGDIARARDEAERAAGLAARAGDRHTELLALSFQAHQETMLSHPEAPRTLERALSEPQDPRVAVDHNGPWYVRYRYLSMSDDLDGARATIAPLVQEAARRGAVESEILFRRCLAETELRAGRCAAALEMANESLRLARDTGILDSAPLFITSLAQAAGGSTDRALELAREAVARSDGDGDLLYLSRTLYALGHAHLVAGDAREAVRLLRQVRKSERELGVTDPARGRWQGDLAEALVLAGEPVEAQQVVDATRARARRLNRVSMLALLDRAQGMVLAARGEPDRAVKVLYAARDRLARLGLRVEEGRTELVLAQTELQRRNHPAARSALDSAVRVFRRAKAKPWLERAEAVRQGADASLVRAPGAFSLNLGELAATEHRVAALVMEGATNREIAAKLFISVKTVEATLTRIYRKLGIRSRVDIVRLASHRVG
jgi:DNA-binding CsgD family transcriptional regulator